MKKLCEEMVVPSEGLVNDISAQNCPAEPGNLIPL